MNQFNATALILAAMAGRPGVAELLLQHSPEPQLLHCAGPDGDSALHAACTYGHAGVDRVCESLGGVGMWKLRGEGGTARCMPPACMAMQV